MKDGYIKLMNLIEQLELLVEEIYPRCEAQKSYGITRCHYCSLDLGHKGKHYCKEDGTRWSGNDDE